MTEKIIDNFFRSRFEIGDRYEAVRYRLNNRIDYDLSLIGEYTNSQSKVLDLGCGTGIIEDRLESKVGFIRGVDMYQEFIEKGKLSDKVDYVKCNICKYSDDSLYDVILLFGVLIYLSSPEYKKVFSNCKKMLARNGVLIIKNQFGIKEKVIVNKYSEELKSDYYAEYHKTDDVVTFLSDLGLTVEIIDIYPPDLNRWNNTHEYALICKNAIQTEPCL